MKISTKGRYALRMMIEFGMNPDTCTKISQVAANQGISDKYLEQIDHFKDMNYYQLDWEEKDIVRVYRERTKNPINAALEIVRYYQNGNYPSVYVNGERIYSKECVIFLNSVNNIVNIIKQTELNPEEVNIIVGNSDDNDRQIARIGEGFKRGRIPLKGETHKKFHRLCGL